MDMLQGDVAAANADGIYFFQILNTPPTMIAPSPPAPQMIQTMRQSMPSVVITSSHESMNTSAVPPAPSSQAERPI